jgi:hypothetical protein
MSNHRKTKTHRLVEMLNNPWSGIKDKPEVFPVNLTPHERHPLTWDLWMEGYQATGNFATARFLGSYDAFSYAEAVQQYLDEKHPTDQKQLASWHDGYCAIWGCRIYDNETDARKYFG